MININLLPPELKLKRLNAKKNASLVSICIVVILVVVVIAILGKSFASTIDAHLATTKNDIEKNNSMLDQYQELKDTALFINDRWSATQKIDETRVYWSQVLQDLINSVPKNVQFENVVVQIDKSPNFVLQGNTTTEREIIKFKEKLENSIFFKNVAFKSASLTADTQTKAETLSFTLEFDLESKSAEASVSGAIDINIDQNKEIYR